MGKRVLYLLAIAGCGGVLFDFGGTIIAPAIPYFEALRLFTTDEISRLTAAVVLTAAVAGLFAGALAEKFGYAPVLVGFAASTVVYFVAAAFFMPETKGRTLEEIESFFSKKSAKQEGSNAEDCGVG